MSTVLPSGSPAPAGEPLAAGGSAAAEDADEPVDTSPRAAPVRVSHGATAVQRPRGGRLDRWPAVVGVPLQVLGRTLAKAWQDRILGLSAEAAFWQILSVP